MNKIVNKTKILVERSKINKIAKAMGCRETAVYNALAYRTNSQMAGDIRSLAINRYGGLKTEIPTLVKE